MYAETESGEYEKNINKVYQIIHIHILFRKNIMMFSFILLILVIPLKFHYTTIWFKITIYVVMYNIKYVSYMTTNNGHYKRVRMHRYQKLTCKTVPSGEPGTLARRCDDSLQVCWNCIT